MLPKPLSLLFKVKNALNEMIRGWGITACGGRSYNDIRSQNDQTFLLNVLSQIKTFLIQLETLTMTFMKRLLS